MELLKDAELHSPIQGANHLNPAGQGIPNGLGRNANFSKTPIQRAFYPTLRSPPESVGPRTLHASHPATPVETRSSISGDETNRNYRERPEKNLSLRKKMRASESRQEVLVRQIFGRP